MQKDQFELHADIEERHWWFVARRRILADLVQRMVPPGGLIVDVGCGTGANIASFAHQYRCFGIDASAEGIELARTRFPQVQFRVGFAPDDLDAEQRNANLFLCTDVMEHVPDDFLFFSRLWNALPVGAQLLLTVPAHECLWSEHDVSFGHYRRYEMERLRQVWNGLPVRERIASYYVSRVYPMVKAVRTLSRWRGRSAGRAGTDFRIPMAPINRFLTWWMAGERHRLAKCLDQPRVAGYRTGVSLIALLERTAGDSPVRERPDSVPADLHSPEPAAV